MSNNVINNKVFLKDITVSRNTVLFIKDHHVEEIWESAGTSFDF